VAIRLVRVYGGCPEARLRRGRPAGPEIEAGPPSPPVAAVRLPGISLP